MSALESANKIKAKFGDLIAEPTEFRGEISLKLADAECVVDVMSFAKAELGFDFLTDISSLDNYGEDPRWTLVYHLYGLCHHQHLRIKTDVSEEKSKLPTITGVWRTADWHEREIYDMMGIHFRGHPDLRRILMWEGYPYFPLRKDFPLAGKSSDLPEIGFSRPAPMEGGPFVTSPSDADTIQREPHAKSFGQE